jgi:hypothetical protein
MLALDLDPARGDVDYQGAELVQLLGRQRRRARARRGSGGTRGQPFEVTWHGRMVAPGTDIGRVIQRVITRSRPRRTKDDLQAPSCPWFVLGIFGTHLCARVFLPTLRA